MSWNRITAFDVLTWLLVCPLVFVWMSIIVFPLHSLQNSHWLCVFSGLWSHRPVKGSVMFSWLMSLFNVYVTVYSTFWVLLEGRWHPFDYIITNAFMSNCMFWFPVPALLAVRHLSFYWWNLEIKAVMTTLIQCTSSVGFMFIWEPFRGSWGQWRDWRAESCHWLSLM